MVEYNPDSIFAVKLESRILHDHYSLCFMTNCIDALFAISNIAIYVLKAFNFIDRQHTV